MTRDRRRTHKADVPDVLLDRIEHVSTVAFNLINWPGREADFAMTEMLCVLHYTKNDDKIEDIMIIETIAEYCWDHLMGEPESPSLQQVIATISLVVSGDQDGSKPNA